MRIFTLETLRGFNSANGEPLIISHFDRPDENLLLKAKESHQYDYFHPDSNTLLNLFKKVNKLGEPYFRQLQVRPNRLERSLYCVGNNGTLFICTSINFMTQEMRDNEIKEHGTLAGYYWGIQALTFMGSEHLDGLADKLLSDYQNIKTLKAYSGKGEHEF